jgi:hypothetical protein
MLSLVGSNGLPTWATVTRMSGVWFASGFSYNPIGGLRLELPSENARQPLMMECEQAKIKKMTNRTALTIYVEDVELHVIKGRPTELKVDYRAEELDLIRLYVRESIVELWFLTYMTIGSIASYWPM